jgi:signal transduction histidine kinase
MMSEISMTEHSGSDNTNNSGWGQAEFLAMIAHELRNANQAILGWVEFADSAPVNPETSARAFEVIKRNAQLQVELINQLIDSSWFNGRSLRCGSQRLAIRQTLEAAVETMMPQASAKDIELRAEIAQSEACVVGDAARLQQVFTNMLANAIKFTPPGGRVEIQCTEGKTHAEVKVSDTGRGIGAEFLPYVFDRFRQETTDTNERNGLGLGLAIARYLVEAHGGRIYADSNGEGHGSTFTVHLPIIC